MKPVSDNSKNLKANAMQGLLNIRKMIQQLVGVQICHWYETNEVFVRCKIDEMKKDAEFVYAYHFYF